LCTRTVLRSRYVIGCSMASAVFARGSSALRSLHTRQGAHAGKDNSARASAACMCPEGPRATIVQAVGTHADAFRAPATCIPPYHTTTIRQAQQSVGQWLSPLLLSGWRQRSQSPPRRIHLCVVKRIMQQFSARWTPQV